MRELHYENQGTNTYLVYAIKEDDSVDSMSLGMLTNNKIHGLAQTLFTQMDNQKYIKFNVSAKVSVAQFFAGSVNKKRLLGVFSGIVNAMLAAEDYMLDPASIIMDMDYIFTDVSTCETDLICLPIVGTEPKQPDLGLFFHNIMFNTQFDQTENCDHVAKIINYLNVTPLFSLTDFKKLLEDVQEQKTHMVVAKVNSDSSAAEKETTAKKQPFIPRTQTVPQQKSTHPLVNNTGNGMNIPPTIKKHPEVTSSEISLFYLMQHYNKENAAAYKAQKEAKKHAAAFGKEKSPARQTPKQKKSQTTTQTDKGFGFAVPGQVAPATQTSTQPVVRQMVPAQKAVSQNTPAQTQSETDQAQQLACVQREVLQGQAANFGETTVLGGGAIGETTVLNVTQNPNKIIAPHLIRKKNNEKISLNKPVFRVGKERSYVDYFIGDNTAISRSHANFITRDGECFVVDTNSTNHTFVNGAMVQSNIETAIVNGDIIRLANEDFEFKLYK